MPELNLVILKTATGSTTANAVRYLPYLAAALQRFEINNDKRIVAFLAQLGHESGGLRYSTELASGAAYEGRADLGNKFPGDGKKFKGRGLIQITGRANYSDVGAALGQNFILYPETLAPANNEVGNALQLKNAVASAAWFWKVKGLNELADKLDFTKSSSHANNVAIFKQITKKINGGYNGLADRQTRLAAGWNIAQKITDNSGKAVAAVFFLVTALVIYWKRKEIKVMLKKYLPKK